MKKLLILIAVLFSLTSFAQQTSRVMSAADATTSANFTFTPGSGKTGSIHIITSSTFSGTTGTIALQGSNDGSTWATVYANDGTTALSFTLTAASTSYVWELENVMYLSYRLVYTKGNTTAGTITTTITQR